MSKRQDIQKTGPDCGVIWELGRIHGLREAAKRIQMVPVDEEFKQDTDPWWAAGIAVNSTADGLREWARKLKRKLKSA